MQKNQNKTFSIFSFLLGLIFFIPSPSYADCTNPASPVGGISYDSAGDFNAVLACDGTNWVPWAGWSVSGYAAPAFSSSSGASALNDLTDVDTTGFSDGKVLMYSAGATGWVPGTISGGSGSPAGNSGEVQFNNSSNFGASSNLFWDNSNGRLGVNDNTPDVALDVVGDINFTGQIVDVSDIRLKENVRPLQSPLKKLTSLNGIAFEMKGDPKHVTEYGVSAQDVEKVFPELVSVVDPDNGTLGVNYNGLIAPLIEAMKEQQAQIEALRATQNRDHASQKNVSDIYFTGVMLDVADDRSIENKAVIQDSLAKLSALNGFTYKLKGDPDETVEYGFSAQDVQSVFPELVHIVDEDAGTLGVNYNGLIAPLIEAIKEQQVQIKALQAEIELLKEERENKNGEQ